MRDHLRKAAPDRGAATIWAAALTGVICMTAVTAMLAGGIRSTRHQAQLAADMAALTAATRHLWGYPDACPQALEAALKAGADLTTCTLTPAPDTPGTIADVTVTITVSPFRWLAPLPIPAKARAGPAASSSPPDFPSPLQEPAPRHRSGAPPSRPPAVESSSEGRSPDLHLPPTRKLKANR